MVSTRAPVWFLTILVGLAALAVIGFRISARYSYQPVIADALTPFPEEASLGINLADGRFVEQSFIAHSRTMTHIGLGIRNLRQAAEDATIRVSLVEKKSGKALQNAEVSLRDIRSDDVTVMPLQSRLQLSDTYIIRISSQGIDTGKDATLFREKSDEAYPEGSLAVIDGPDSSIDLAGNIRFQIIRFATPFTLFAALSHSPVFWLVLLYCAILCCFPLMPFTQRFFLFFERRYEIIPTHTVPWKEVLLATGIGIIAAAIVTYPYYDSLDKMSTLGDVQRALVYRGVARDSLLQDRQIGVWDPYLCGGNPLLANPESAHLDPFFLLILLFGENAGLRLSITGSLVIAFAGCWWIVRRYLGAHFLPSLLAGIIYAYSGFTMLAFAEGYFAWIPLCFIPLFVSFFLESINNSRYIAGSAMMLAWIFFGGSVHMAIFAVIAGILLGIWIGVFSRTLRPLAVLLITLSLTVPLAAVKLLPVLSVQALGSDFSRPAAVLPSPSWFPRMFLDRMQDPAETISDNATKTNYRWVEFGAYTGVLPFVLFIVAVYCSRRKSIWPFIISSLVLFPVIFGIFPQRILSGIPFLNEILRQPNRLRGLFLFFLAIVAAYGLHHLFFRKKKTAIRHTLALLIIALVFFDISSYHAPLYKDFFNLDIGNAVENSPFERVDSSYSTSDGRYYHVSYLNYLANEGTTDKCFLYLGDRQSARGIDTSNPLRPYLGEAFFADGREVTTVDIHSNFAYLTFPSGTEGWLVLNQNYFPGWTTEPHREISQRDGLVAARVLADDTHVTFRYKPRHYEAGLYITLAALFCIAWWLLPMRRREGRQ